MLNSSTVDVDKLDYIARDTQMSGYDNIVLDTDRLLDNICIVCKDNVYYPAFKKGALSIINNVVIAKNLQARWIVNHPIVIYEAYILRRAIGEALNNANILLQDQEDALNFDDCVRFIFSSNSLSKNGNIHKNGRYSLLSDIEILNLMKSNIDNSFISEYFSRDERKNPIWKSNEEFLFCLGSDDKKAAEVAEYIAPLINYFNDIEDICNPKQIDESLYNEILSDNNIEGKDALLNIIKILSDYAPNEEFSEKLNYVILPAKNNFFANIDSASLYIRFGDDKSNFTSYDSFESNLGNPSNKKYGFFYLYCNKKINAKHFLNYLYQSAHDDIGVRI